MNTENSELELSCRESNLLIKVIPLRKNAKEMTKEEIAAIRHYIYCKDCRDKGLTEILDTKLSCREAILVWAERASALWLRCSSEFGPQVETLIELYAVEHVWGKYQWKNSMGGNGWETFTGCHQHPCRALHSYWANVPMSSSAGNGPGGVIHLFPFLFKIFISEKWPLDDLCAVQKKRIANLLEDITNGFVTVSSGHYHSIDQLAQEIQEQFAALQKFVLLPK